jgi:hypothetical protein
MPESQVITATTAKYQNILFDTEVFNREAGQQSNLSNFLVGCAPGTPPMPSSCSYSTMSPDNCTVGDPQTQCALNLPGQESVLDPANHSNGNHPYGDIALRQVHMQGLASLANELFLPFIRPHIGGH